jgi:hypothetical protein
MGKAVPDVLIMDSPSGCQVALAYLCHSQLLLTSAARRIAGQGGWPARTGVCRSPRILIVEGGGEVRDCNNSIVRGLGYRR